MTFIHVQKMENRAWKEERKNEYPEPLASHGDLVNDPLVFWDTLRRFHFLMGTKFMVPVIGGKELDLHLLYVEAAKRGGFEKVASSIYQQSTPAIAIYSYIHRLVVAEKKWREVGSVFQLSPTTTSASFVLRKHYLGLLYHYEQVHLFKAKGALNTPINAPTPAAATFAVGDPSLAIVEYSPNPIREHPAPPQPLVEGVGTIEGKFDCGYLVRVRLGSEVLKGVLYHVPAEQPSTSSGNIVQYYRRKRRRKRRGRAADPGHPKPNRSGYNFFFAEQHYKLRSLYPNKEREFTKMIGHSWSKLNPEERMVYQNIGLEDKERYKRELKEYRERLKQTAEN